jgi:hypothetical protein
MGVESPKAATAESPKPAREPALRVAPAARESAVPVAPAASKPAKATERHAATAKHLREELRGIHAAHAAAAAAAVLKVLRVREEQRWRGKKYGEGYW